MKYYINNEKPELAEASLVVASAMPAIPYEDITQATSEHLNGTHVQSIRKETGELVGFANYELFGNKTKLYLAGRAIHADHQRRSLWEPSATSNA
jgi:hypothetical protein